MTIKHHISVTFESENIVTNSLLVMTKKRHNYVISYNGAIVTKSSELPVKSSSPIVMI